jgi:hypothetical protein
MKNNANKYLRNNLININKPSILLIYNSLWIGMNLKTLSLNPSSKAITKYTPNLQVNM